MKVTFLNSGWRREYERDLRSNEHYLSSRETKAWKRFKPVRVWTHELCDTDAALYQLS